MEYHDLCSSGQLSRDLKGLPQLVAFVPGRQSDYVPTSRETNLHSQHANSAKTCRTLTFGGGMGFALCRLLLTYPQNHLVRDKLVPCCPMFIGMHGGNAKSLMINSLKVPTNSTA